MGGANVLAAVVGGLVSSGVTGWVAWRQGKATGRAERLEGLEERLRRVELRTESLRAAQRIERRKQERRQHREQD